MKRRGLAVLLGVVAVQIVLTALVFNPTPHNGGDNAGYVSLGYSLLHQGSYRELWDPLEPPHTKYPPLFPLLLAGVMALGVKGWVGLKTVPFLSTLLAGVFTFLWVRGRAGAYMAAGVTLILALSDGVLDYSRWILSDPTFLALTMGALWALERGKVEVEETRPGEGDTGKEAEGADGSGSAQGPERGSTPSGTWQSLNSPSPTGWQTLGCVLVILAYFTRSAGLPLVVAVLAWLAVRRRFRALVAFLAAFALPAGLWWLRGRIQGGSQYVSEFWFLDPYRPELGRVGAGGLVVRVWENFLSYTTNYVPEGIVGGSGGLLPILGVALVVLALLGWVRSLRKDPGAAEFFLPLYAGLMFLWPAVWSGDRFALPLLPILLFYAGSGISGILGSSRPVLRNAILGAAFLILALPAMGNWMERVQSTESCRGAAREGGAWACYGLNVREYTLMADWAGRNLPPGSALVTRKPRIFYLLSGVKTLSLPLTTDPEVFLETAGEKGARYVTVDRLDGLAGYYLPKVVGGRPEAFCYITGVESGGEAGIQLLGIMDPERAEEASREFLSACPGDYTRPEPLDSDPVPSGMIPLLVRGFD